jgi:hypothetical protein
MAHLPRGRPLFPPVAGAGLKERRSGRGWAIVPNRCPVTAATALPLLGGRGLPLVRLIATAMVLKLPPIGSSHV